MNTLTSEWLVPVTCLFYKCVGRVKSSQVPSSGSVFKLLLFLMRCDKIMLTPATYLVELD